MSGKIALLTAGSSLPRVWNESKYGDYSKVIAVNCAAMNYRCQLACGLDEWVLEEFERRGLNVERFATRCGFSPLTFPCALRMCCLTCDFEGASLDVYGLDMAGRGVNANSSEFDAKRVKRELPWVLLALEGCKCNVRIFGDVEDGIRKMMERPRPVEYEESMK